MTREDAIRIIKIVLAVAEDFEITVQGEEFTEEKCKEAVEMAAKALEQESKTGHWEKTTDGYCYWYKCSCCGTKTPKNEWGSDYFSSYCPECGIKMVEPQERSE